MRTYELMVVLKPDVDPKDTKTIEDKIKKLVAGQNVTVKEVLVQGKKQLAYPIEKFTEGVYVLVQIEAEALKVEVIEQRVKLGMEVLRYLLTVKE